MECLLENRRIIYYRIKLFIEKRSAYPVQALAMKKLFMLHRKEDFVRLKFKRG